MCKYIFLFNIELKSETNKMPELFQKMSGGDCHKSNNPILVIFTFVQIKLKVKFYIFKLNMETANGEVSQSSVKVIHFDFSLSQYFLFDLPQLLLSYRLRLLV